MWPCSSSNIKRKARGDKAKAKDLTLKAKVKAKNLGLKAKAKD
jgi:hypothetical protein